MKRHLLLAATMGTLLVGCASNDTKTEMKSPSATMPTAAPAAPANPPATPVAAKPSSGATPEYFEIPKDGKMYVFSSSKSMQDFFGGADVPTRSIDGIPGVLFEGDANADTSRLVATYKKNHGM